MNSYRHTQRGTLIVVAMLALAALFVVLGLLVSKAVLATIPILLLSGWLFHSLTIEITPNELRWRFGPGFIRKAIPIADIADAKAVTTNVIEGWGIHYSRFGWLYNVSGFGAVAITLTSGKRFALGTDEPQSLAAALQGAAARI